MHDLYDLYDLHDLYDLYDLCDLDLQDIIIPDLYDLDHVSKQGPYILHYLGRVYTHPAQHILTAGQNLDDLDRDLSDLDYLDDLNRDLSDLDYLDNLIRDLSVRRAQTCQETAVLTCGEGWSSDNINRVLAIDHIVCLEGEN